MLYYNPVQGSAATICVSDVERIWAGVDNVYGEMSTMSEPQPTAKGSLCYYQSKEGEDKWRESNTFRYGNALRRTLLTMLWGW